MNSPVRAQINLYDPALREVVDPWSLRNIALAATGICVVMILWAALAISTRASLQNELTEVDATTKGSQEEIKRLAAAIAEQKPDPQLEKEVSQSQAYLQSRTQVLAVLQRGFTPEALTPADVLSGLARQVPRDLWLTAFSLSLDSGELEIRGGTNDPVQIASYVSSLGKEKAFAGRTFATLEVTKTKPVEPASAAIPAAPLTPAAAGALRPPPMLPVGSPMGSVANPLAQGAQPGLPNTGLVSAPAVPQVPQHHQFRLSSTLREQAVGEIK